MPTYDYKCNACGHAFELFQQMSDAVKRKCPKCGKPKLERLIGIGAGVLFKGGGFYETDYRSDGYTKAAEADKKAAEGKSEPTKAEAATTAASDVKAEATGPKPEKDAAKSAPESASESKSARRGAEPARSSSGKSVKPRRKR